MGFSIILDTVFNNPNLKKLPKYDPRESSGSLMLVDFSSPYGYDGGSTIPTTNTVVNNILWETASAIIGSGNKASLSAIVQQSNFNSNEGIVEFSTKKGLHVIVSQVNSVQNHAFVLSLPSPIKQYILSNANHKYYVSIWSRRTRAALSVVGNTATNYAITVLGNNSQTTSNHLSVFTALEIYPTAASGKRLGVRETSANSVGYNFKNIAVNGYTGTQPSLANFDSAIFKAGSFSAFSAFEQNRSASDIFYSFYMEDLTVSGRNYADVDSIDKSEYDSATSVGGRFYGDTFTNPSTLP